jgi:hypothetical protein
MKLSLTHYLETKVLCDSLVLTEAFMLRESYKENAKHIYSERLIVFLRVINSIFFLKNVVSRPTVFH